MKTILPTLIVITTLAAGTAAQASSAYRFDAATQPGVSITPGARFVRVGYDAGYYVVPPLSPAATALGVNGAPYVDSDNIARNGVGLDAIAFRFGADGTLAGFPVYLGQLAPDSFYTERLRAFSPRHSTLAQVRELFDRHDIEVRHEGALTIAYVKVPVYDPLASGS
ncbi:MAG: hypothetical protein WDO13_10290 [Verrucomicrobiota bacterium]